jgi:hypothetical protein
MALNVEEVKNLAPQGGMDFHIKKLSHVVLQVSDLERSTEFLPRFSASKFRMSIPKK